MANKYRYKKLLNLPAFHSVAAISISLEIEEWNDNAIGGSITISSCNKIITLDLDYSNSIERTNSIRKIETMIKGLEGAKKWIEDHEKA